MQGKLIAAGAALAASAAFSAPAQAIGYDAGISGDIDVRPDLSACASLTWTGGLVVGQFAAVGEMQGPGTKYGTVRGAVPIVASGGSWYGCISGAYEPATAGEGKFTLTASGLNGDHVTVEQCTITFGALTCV